MQTLFRILYRFNALGVFIVLQIFCAVLIVKYNKEQGAIFRATTQAFSGWTYSLTYGARKFFNYRQENERLAEDNARLFKQLEASQFNSIVKVDTTDNAAYRQQYVYTQAEVVNNSFNKANNYITINRGSKHGIKPHSGVIGGRGLVGIVIRTSPNYSVVMSLLHQQMKVSVFVKGKGYFGSMVWGGESSSLMDVEAIPRHANVQRGDTIITSGYSSIFPAGMAVGVVEEVTNVGGSSFDHISVELLEKLVPLQRVYVVNNLFREEQKELEENEGNE